ncbi:MAG: DUF975 family protein [Oscillospiraceae bacterium]|jgi:uncharacterized membrane protein|nr:DUF975 family protein [Oscillospiraceae bacterium]
MPERIKQKLSAKFIMRENARSVYLISFILTIISNILGHFMRLLLGTDHFLADVNDAALSGGDFVGTLEAYDALAERLTPVDGLLTLVMGVIAAIISMGYYIVILRLTRGQSAEVKGLFDGFAFPLKVVWLNIVTGFFIFLWTILFIVPGIIAAFRYSMAVYILADDPTKGALECIRESKQMMKSHKLNLFVLELSFLGWLFIAGFVATLFTFIIGLQLDIFMIWLTPYMELTRANFYNSVSGRAPLRLPPDMNSPEP